MYTIFPLFIFKIQASYDELHNLFWWHRAAGWDATVLEIKTASTIEQDYKLRHVQVYNGKTPEYCSHCVWDDGKPLWSFPQVYPSFKLLRHNPLELKSTDRAIHALLSSAYLWWPPILPYTQVVYYSLFSSDLSSHFVVLEGSVTNLERTQLLGQKGVTVWLTGLSASGKVWSLIKIPL